MRFAYGNGTGSTNSNVLYYLNAHRLMLSATNLHFWVNPQKYQTLMYLQKISPLKVGGMPELLHPHQRKIKLM